MKNYVVFNEADFKKRVEICISLLEVDFGLCNMDKVKIDISNRMTRGFGYWMYKVRGREAYKTIKLQFSSRLLDGRFYIKNVDEIILHEVIHYLLFEKTRINHHHDKVFHKYCEKYGTNSNGEIDCKLTELGEKIKKQEQEKRSEKSNHIREPKYNIICEECGHTYTRTRKCKLVDHPNNFKCFCGGSLYVVKNN